MGTTAHGIVYPDPAAVPARSALETLAESVEDALVDTFEIGDPWTAYTPTLGGFTLGNGTITGRRSSPASWVHFSIEFTFGSTSSTGGGLSFGLPVTARNPSSLEAYPVNGSGLVLDVSATARLFVHPALTSDGTAVRLYREDGTAVSSGAIPWATDDQVIIVGTYEAA